MYYIFICRTEERKNYSKTGSRKTGDAPDLNVPGASTRYSLRPVREPQLKLYMVGRLDFSHLPIGLG